MRLATFPIRLLALASALALVSSCGDKRELQVDLNPPADLLERPDKPVMPAEALTSEAAYEAWREDVNDWGDNLAGIVDEACAWFRDAGVTTLRCRGRPPAE